MVAAFGALVATSDAMYRKIDREKKNYIHDVDEATLSHSLRDERLITKTTRTTRRAEEEKK